MGFRGSGSIGARKAALLPALLLAVATGTPVEADSGAAVITFSRAADIVGDLVEQPGRSQKLAPPAYPGSGARPAWPIYAPLAAYALTSGFGGRWHPILGEFRNHAGIDLAAPIGSAVYAPSGGVVRFAQWNGGYGLFVVLDHGGGLMTRYGHLSRVNVVPGQVVRAGDLLAYVGSSGLSTGPHLHYEIWFNGAAIDPGRYLRRR